MYINLLWSVDYEKSFLKQDVIDAILKAYDSYGNGMDIEEWLYHDLVGRADDILEDLGYSYSAGTVYGEDLFDCLVEEDIIDDIIKEYKKHG